MLLSYHPTRYTDAEEDLLEDEVDENEEEQEVEEEVGVVLIKEACPVVGNFVEGRTRGTRAGRGSTFRSCYKRVNQRAHGESRDIQVTYSQLVLCVGITQSYLWLLQFCCEIHS